MTPEALWNRYAAIWSLDAEAREPEMLACLAMSPIAILAERSPGEPVSRLTWPAFRRAYREAGSQY